MKARLERKELPVCTLVVMKTGPMLKAHPADSARPCDSFGRGSATFTNMPVADLVEQLSLDLGTSGTRWNRTRGPLRFFVKLDPAPNEGGTEAFGLAPRAEPPPPDNSNGPSIFRALWELLGLKLKSAKGPVDILVIDHVERASEN